jgi:hypothetical protein
VDDPSDVTIAKGQLVRFLETTTRWYLALVRTVKGDQVELRFFDGRAPVRIPRTQIESFNEFLSERERKFSVERSRLTELFYGRAIERLRAERLDEMQSALRKGGIAFDPEDWPTADTRIRLWSDSSVVARNGAPHSRLL